MALEPCKECGKPVSTKATTCPNCGALQPASYRETYKRRLPIVMLAFVAIVAVIIIGAAVAMTAGGPTITGR